MKQLARHITFFVQNCFKIEKYHHELIDTLTNINDIVNYNYYTNWDYSFISENNQSLLIYDLDTTIVSTLLYSNFIFASFDNNVFKVSESLKTIAQALIDKNYYKMPDLLPVQFYYLLAKTGLDEAITQLLPPLKESEPNKYAMYKSFLYGARYYEFSKAFHMYTDIKDKLLVINSNLSYTLTELKTIWLEASLT